MSTDWRFPSERHDEDDGGWLGLLTFVAACIGVGVGLWWFTGPPTMLMSVPDWSYIREALGGSELRDRDVITVTTGVAWLIVGYVLLSVALRLLLGTVFAITGGAAWARAVLQATSPLTIPVVRRMVDGALAGTIMISATLHTPTAAFASSSSMTAVVETRVPTQMTAFDLSTVTPSAPAPSLLAENIPKTHTVARGDNLWRIAERHLGDGFRWIDIWKLNQHQTMTDGRRFVDPNLIYPGWVLELPQDSIAPEPADVIDEEEENGTTPEPEPITTPTGGLPTAESTPVTSTPEPTIVPIGETTPKQDDSGTSGLRPSLPSIPTPDSRTALATAAITVGGAAMLLVFRRARRQWSTESNGRHERRPAGTGDAARVLAASSALRSALSELDFADTDVVLVRESDRYLEFTLACPPGDASALVESRHTLSRPLGCAVDGKEAGPTTVLLKLSRMHHLAAALFADNPRESRPLLVPVGASDSGVHYLNLAAVGSVLVVGSRLEARDLIASWFTTLDSLHPEGTVNVVADEAAWDPLGDCMDLLPSAPDADPPAASPAEFASWLEARLLARADGDELPALLALTELPEDKAAAVATMEGVLRQGPGRGIFVLALAEARDGAGITQAFGASLVLSGSNGGGRPGAITLAVAHLPPLELEPVVVRRAVARRSQAQVPAIEAVDADAMDREQTLSGDGHTTASPEANGSGEMSSFEDLLDAASHSDRHESPVPPSTNGIHPAEPVADPTPVESAPAVLANGLDRQAALPVDGLDTDGSPDSGPPFRAKLFGTFRVETENAEVTGWSIQKARELLAYLLAHGGAPVLRDTATEALWPNGENLPEGHPLANAAYYVRRTLNRAAPNIEGQILVTASQRYHLRTGVFRTDIDAFDAHLARAERLQGYEALVEYQRALEIYTADFLTGEDYEWADAYRRDYESRFIRAARCAARLAQDLRDPRLALTFCEAILRHDPIDEEAAREAMRCHAALGDRNAVKRVYKSLTEELHEALEDDQAEPMPETTRLLCGIIQSSTGNR